MAMWLFHSNLLILFILLFCACFYKPVFAKREPKTKRSELPSDEIICEKNEVLSGNAHRYVWKQKYRSDLTVYAPSEGEICLDNKTSELFIRECNPMTGEWSPPSDSVRCAVFQKQLNRLCPEDLIELSVRGGEVVCLKLSAEAWAFNESFCYGSDTLFGEKSMKNAEIEAILQYLNISGIQRFWLPVRRATYNKYYNPFVVRLPGHIWGDTYQMPTLRIETQDLIVGHNCMSSEIIQHDQQFSFRSQITNCSEALTMVCIYRKDFVAYSGCPQGFGALAYKPNECYGIEWEAGLFPYDLRSIPVAEYITKRNSLQHIFHSIGFKRNRFFLIGNFSDSSKKQYAIEMNSKEDLRIVPFGGRHHALSSEFLTNLNRKSVEMVLNINPQLGGLTLTIYNRNYIWRFSDEDNFGVKCFTNSQSEKVQWKAVKIKMLWQNTLETKALFKVKQSKNDGYYWCEAHTIFDFSIIRTKKILVSYQKRGHTYAVLLDLPCQGTECYNIYSTDTWKHLNKKAKTILNDIETKQPTNFEVLKISNSRLMDIAAIYNNGTLLQGLVHVDSYLKSSSVDQESEQSSEEFYNEETNFSITTIVRMKVYRLLTELLKPFSSKLSHIVRSTMFCFPETFFMESNETNSWLLSKYGQASTTAKLCLHETGEPVSRRCQGEFLWGAYWESAEQFQQNQPCSQSKQYNIITYQLRDLEAKNDTKKSTSKALKSVRSLIEKNLENLIPADFYYIARIMHNTMKIVLRNDNSNFNTNDAVSVEIARVYNFLMEVNKRVVQFSTLLNSTNVLLEAFERTIDEEAIRIQAKTPLSNNSDTIVFISENTTPKNKHGLELIQYDDIGVDVKIANNFLIFVLDPNVANVTGVALYHKKADASDENYSTEGDLQGSFKNEFYRFIISNQSVDDLLFEDNLQLATYVPHTLWNRLDEISKQANVTTKIQHSTRFIIKIYANDILFQKPERSDTDDKTVSGKIVSVSIPGHDKDLPEMLPLIFKIPSMKTGDENTEPICSYWDYDTWANDGLTFLGRSEVDNSIILCGCTHLTPFAYLIGDTYKLPVDSNKVAHIPTHQKVLDFITVLGCSLSLIGTLGIFVTAATFQSWRQKASSKVLLQLSCAISLQMVLFCFVNTEENLQQLLHGDIFSSCIAIGALLHYSVLVQFCWMVIIGYLQFKRYVQVFGNPRPKSFFKKSFIIGWGAPLIPVALVLIFDRKSYIPDSAYTQAICYPSGFSLYFGVIFPITAVIIANFVIFSIILYNILRGPEGTLRHTEKGLALSQLRLSALLFFLLGFTWIFGLLASLKAGIVFSYLFCLTATLQGFVIFIYFVILDPKTRRMWRGIFVRVCGLKESYESSISMKETTQTLR